MKTLFATSSILLMTALPASAEPLSDATIQGLDAAINSAIEEHRVAGAVVVVAKDGEIVYHRAAGEADSEARRAMTEDTVFRLASASKPIVTTAAMRLVDMGLLDLDAPVTNWLPDFRPGYEGTSPVITLRQLLSHTSGVGYPGDEGDSGPYHEAGIQHGGTGTGISLAENVGRLGSVPLHFAPGESFNYGLGVDVIGRVIEVATNLPLEVAVSDLVTAPLEMSDTGFSVPAWDVDRLAANYRDGEDGPQRMEDGDSVPLLDNFASFEPSRNTNPDAWPSAGAGMSSTASDMMKMFIAITGDDGFLEPSTVDAMMTPEIAGLPIVDVLMDLYGGMPDDGAAWGFGIGGAILIDPAKANTPQSPGTFAWSGAYGNTWFIDPAEDLIMVALTNTAWEGIYGEFPHEIRDAIYTTR